MSRLLNQEELREEVRNRLISNMNLIDYQESLDSIVQLIQEQKEIYTEKLREEIDNLSYQISMDEGNS